MLFVFRLVLLSLCSAYCGEKSLEIAWDFSQSQRDGNAQNIVQDGHTGLQRKQTRKEVVEAARQVRVRAQVRKFLVP